MSKSSLKKELQKLDKEQLIEIILDHYSARKDAKNYFDFFIDPDSKKLETKYRAIIARELDRTKWRLSKARISIIKKAIKEFESYSPDFESIVDLHLYTIRMALLKEKHFEFSDSMINGIDFITVRLLDIADRNLVLDRIITELNRLINDENAGSIGFRNYLEKIIQSFIRQKAI